MLIAELFCVLDHDIDRLLDINKSLESFSMSLLWFYPVSEMYTREHLGWDRLHARKEMLVFVSEYLSAILGETTSKPDGRFWFSAKYRDYRTFLNDLIKGECFLTIPIGSGEDIVLRRKGQ